MLFHVTSTHEPASCPAASGASDSVHKLASSDWATTNGVTAHQVLVCGPRHTFFMTLEAEHLIQISEFLSPLKQTSQIDITPVGDLLRPQP